MRRLRLDENIGESATEHNLLIDSLADKLGTLLAEAALPADVSLDYLQTEAKVASTKDATSLIYRSILETAAKGQLTLGAGLSAAERELKKANESLAKTKTDVAEHLRSCGCNDTATGLGEILTPRHEKPAPVARRQFERAIAAMPVSLAANKLVSVCEAKIAGWKTRDAAMQKCIEQIEDALRTLLKS